MLDYKTPLAEANNIPRKELIEVENDEAQSRLKMKLAKDKLLVYGLTEKEIENARNEDGVQKAKMILRSRAAGVVVLRSVVPGNYYTSADLLMTIAPLDHLWVRGSVSELDADQVEVGQKLKIIFPFSDRTIDATVDYIDKAIDSDSRSAKFRTTIPNPEGRLKAGMFVRMLLEIPPKPGQTVIPRIAMVSVDRYDYVFVKKPGKANQFERRQIVVVKENNDVVIVAEPSVGQRRSHTRRGSRDDRQLDPRADVRGQGHDRRGPARLGTGRGSRQFARPSHAGGRDDTRLSVADAHEPGLRCKRIASRSTAHLSDLIAGPMPSLQSSQSFQVADSSGPGKTAQCDLCVLFVVRDYADIPSSVTRDERYSAWSGCADSTGGDGSYARIGPSASHL